MRKLDGFTLVILSCITLATAIYAILLVLYCPGILHGVLIFSSSLLTVCIPTLIYGLLPATAEQIVRRKEKERIDDLKRREYYKRRRSSSDGGSFFGGDGGSGDSGCGGGDGGGCGGD